LPSIVKAVKFGFILITELCEPDVLNLLLDILELFLDGISSGLENVNLSSDLRVEVFVLFQMLQLCWGSLEFIDGLCEFGQQLVKVFFALLDQMLEDLLDEVIAILSQAVLQLRTVQDYELLGLLRLLVLDVVPDIHQTLN